MNKNFKISPFEGQPLLPFCIVLIIIFGSLGIFLHGILSIIMWVLVVPFAFFLFSMITVRLSHKWAKVHYPVMIRYSRMAGMAMGLYPNKRADERVDIALALLLQSLYPNMSADEAQKMYEQMMEKGDVFHDKNMLTKAIERKAPNKNREECEKMANQIIEQYKTENGMRVSHVVSELIKYKYGESEQLEYMFAVLTNRAK